jgi:GGDEF domain-containing protein
VYAGTEGADAVSRAADALGGVIWSAIREELSYPDADQISELAERLTRVIEVVRRAALRRSGQGERRVMEPAEPVEPVEHRRIAWPPPAPTSPTAPSSSQAPGAPPAPVAAAGAPLWQGALAEEVIRAERTGTPLSLLLVELEDAERLTAAEPAHEAAATFGRFAQAVRSVARRQDILACESEARAWVIARDTTRSGARTLAERIVGAVREAHPWRGAPLTVNLGLAVYGEDGRGAAALIESAEQAMFAAAASGNEVADPAGDD